MTEIANVAVRSLSTASVGRRRGIVMRGNVMSEPHTIGTETANDANDPIGRMHVRSLSIIAEDIARNWTSVYFGAVPYLVAMRRLGAIGDTYGCDSADSIVRYFLSNAKTWRGDDARRIKAELKAMLK